MSTEKKQGFSTQQIHAGYNPKEHNNAIQVPIYQTAAFDITSPERAEKIIHFEEIAYLYTRVGNPTNAVLEARVAELDGAAAAVSLASGQAAVSYAILNAGEGGRVIAAAKIYGGTYDGYRKAYPNLGVQIDLLHNVNDLDEIKSLIKPDTRAIYIESISNPTIDIANIEAIAQVAHENGLPLIVDNTLATPYLFNPLKHGADVVVYSATKALSGHGAIIGGLILESGKFNWLGGRHPHFEEEIFTFGNRNVVETFSQFPFTGRVRTNYLALLGASLSPFNAFQILQGIETLNLRVKQESESALKIAQWLEKQPKVSKVNYAALPSSPSYALAEKYFPKGVGGLLSFDHSGTQEEIYLFINSLTLFSYHANLGDNRSLVINSPKTTHHELTPEELIEAGINPGTIRISIGLEEVEDLIADLKQAFETSNK
ncbi:MAG: aminotransferase class I/II-fold pyridoxal phosphate-dependent enzyme [Bacteroidales bacterium]|jgi:O-acetylhomoserine (thiol)-lyase|nr:aminotransferase class I/II-fold pyridoxal phosphate-dependent enzyme [Bacteroidales bacterium]